MSLLPQKPANLFIDTATRIGEKIGVVNPELVYNRAEAAPKTYNVRGYTLNDDDFEEARKILFSEISNRSPDKQIMESKVILNTALNRMKQYGERGRKLSLAEVLREPNQYQGYNSKQYHRANEKLDPVSQNKMDTIQQVLQEIRTKGLEDTTSDAVYYVHAPDGSIWIKRGKLYK